MEIQEIVKAYIEMFDVMYQEELEPTSESVAILTAALVHKQALDKFCEKLDKISDRTYKQW